MFLQRLLFPGWGNFHSPCAGFDFADDDGVPAIFDCLRDGFDRFRDLRDGELFEVCGRVSWGHVYVCVIQGECLEVWRRWDGLIFSRISLDGEEFAGGFHC